MKIENIEVGKLGNIWGKVNICKWVLEVRWMWGKDFYKENEKCL